MLQNVAFNLQLPRIKRKTNTHVQLESTAKTTVIRAVKLFGLLHRYQRFGEACYFLFAVWKTPVWLIDKYQ